MHVIDDDPALRDSLACLLDAVGLPVQVYASAEAFLRHAAHVQPGCIVTDVRMPDMGGLELIGRLKALGVDLPVIVMTGHADVPLAIEAMRAGVVDFVEKPFEDEALLGSIGVALAQGQERQAQQARDEEQSAVRARIEALSPRERDVLRGLVAGQANKVIAYELGISPRTVETYRANLMIKTGAGSLSELVRMTLPIGDL